MAGDVTALKQLDVLVANEDWMAPDSELKAVELWVSEGMGLINIGGMGVGVAGGCTAIILRRDD